MNALVGVYLNCSPAAQRSRRQREGGRTQSMRRRVVKSPSGSAATALTRRPSCLLEGQRENEKAPQMRGFSIGAPRFELGTSRQFRAMAGDGATWLEVA